MCENSARKQNFLRLTNVKGGMLINDAKELVKTFARNVCDGVLSPIPWAFLLIAGFVCSDKSPCNNSAKKFRKSMQELTGQTSHTFELLLAYILVARPVVVILENVKELMCVDDSSNLSDCVYVCQKLSAAGYGIVTYFVTRTEQFASRAVRIRIYFVGIRCPKSICNNIVELLEAKRNMIDAQKCYW